MTFKEFWNLVKYADAFYKFMGDFGDTGLPEVKAKELEKVNSQKLKLTVSDIQKIRALSEFIGKREINFKHFLVWMMKDSIFAKWEQQNDRGCFLEDLEAGLNQLSLPLLKGATKDAKKGALLDKSLYDWDKVISWTLSAEIRVCEDMAYRSTLSQELMKNINSKNLDDAVNDKT